MVSKDLTIPITWKLCIFLPAVENIDKLEKSRISYIAWTNRINLLTYSFLSLILIAYLKVVTHYVPEVSVIHKLLAL